MSSAYQRTTSGNQGLMDAEQNYIIGSQVDVYPPPEDRRMQSGDLSRQEMIGIHNSGNDLNYHYEPEHSMETRRPRHRAPDFSNSSHGRIRYGERVENADYGGPGYGLERFGNDDNNQYGNSTGTPRVNIIGRVDTHESPEYSGPGYDPEGFGNCDNNQYGSSTGTPRVIINDRDDAHENAEYLAASQHQTGNPRPYNSHTSLGFEEEVETESSYQNSEIEDQESLFVPGNDRMQKKRQRTNETSPGVGRPIRFDDLNMQVVANPRIRLRPTRIQNRLNVNLVPPTVPTSSISDAALLKRGLKRSKNAVMSKKSHGPNDPENILIVNLRENEDKSWPDISLILNERRIKEGKSPSFTPNGCHNRYNRNAPILFAAEGKEFIPVNMQRKLKKNPTGPVIWTDKTDTLLIKAVKEVESRKWAEVAQLFNAQGPYKITAAEAAMRTKVI